MRRRTIAVFGLVLGLLASLATAARAQTGSSPSRPRPKIMTPAAPETTSLVGVIGHVGRPGTYQFAAAPTLELAIAAANGTTAEASDMVRLVRGGRVTQSVACSVAAGEKLQSGDLVVIDGKTSRRHFDPATGKEYVWLAFMGVLPERPCVLPVEIDHAYPQVLVEKLGQPLSILSSVRMAPPPANGLRSTGGQPLSDGTVLFFDQSLIQVNHLPNDLPPVLPCGLPEPEIGAYGLHGVRNAYEERMQQQELPGDPREAPQRELRLPTPDRSEPTPIPLPDEPLPTISAAKQSAGSPTISTLPYSTGPSPITARGNRLSGLAPTRDSTARDAQPPAWKSGPTAADDQLADQEIDQPEQVKVASGPLTLWQMFTILASAGLLVGLALAVRTWQGRHQPRREPGSASQPQSAAQAAETMPEAKPVVPPPHLPLRSFLATTASRTVAASGTREELTQRQRALIELLNHAMPIIEEPLALRPDIPLGSPAIEKPIWRRDAPTVLKEPLISSPASTPVVTSPQTRQHLDAPHPRLSSGPHLRVGPEAPVERALRQLQGGRS